MDHDKLVEYIKGCKLKGFSSKQIKDHLIKNRYPEAIIEDAMHATRIDIPDEPVVIPKRPFNWKLLLVGIILILIGISSIYGVKWYNRPRCGNGVYELGETMENCCSDVGCMGQQSCTDSGCKDPECGSCQYLKDFHCIKFRCCSDTDCDDGQIATVDSCTGYPKNCSYAPFTDCTPGDSYCPEGCNNSVDNDCAVEIVEIATSSCVLTEDCPDGTHCFKGDCLSNKLLGKFDPCKEDCREGECNYNLCPYYCETCNTSQLSCMSSGDDMLNGLCVECYIDSMCAANYTCKKYLCAQG